MGSAVTHCNTHLRTAGREPLAPLLPGLKGAGGTVRERQSVAREQRRGRSRAGAVSWAGAAADSAVGQSPPAGDPHWSRNPADGCGSAGKSGRFRCQGKAGPAGQSTGKRPSN